MAKIVSITNQKGGVGKTTTSINLSSCLARADKKVLIVDMDPQGNTSSGIGADKMNINKTVYEGIIDDLDPKEIIYHTEYDNLDLLPSNVNLTGAEIELTNTENREYKLKELLDKVSDQYNFIIIDCPPSLGLLTLNSLCASDTVLIPLQPEFFALEGISHLVHTLKLVQDNLNNKLKIEGILITMCDIRTNLAKQVMADVIKYFKHKVYKTIIPRNVKIAESPSFGQPIVYYDMRSIGAEKYLEFTSEFLKVNQEY